MGLREQKNGELGDICLALTLLDFELPSDVSVTVLIESDLSASRINLHIHLR